VPVSPDSAPSRNSSLTEIAEIHRLAHLLPPTTRRLPVMNVAAPLMAKIKANSTESRTLANLRETLLPKLLSGDISPIN
jgi:type I restriction enzyme S subunit